MKYLMLFADNFEDVEAIATLDVLKRGGDIVTSASIMGRLNVKTKCGNILTVDTLIEDVVDTNPYDALIIPGGPGSFKIMPNVPIVEELIHTFIKRDKVVAAICAAPHLIGKLGYFKDKKYTVHPGFQDQIIGGTYLRDNGVVVDGKFITAKSMYYSIEFGLTIYGYFHGEANKEALRKACMGEKE
jgi:4-methyl-5(b-hydroxyethyl)-thiazole monophosphate biosynthesis